MAAARKFNGADEAFNEQTRDVMRSLWRVVNNESSPEQTPASHRLDIEELQRTLALVRDSIRKEQERSAQLQERIAELEDFEEAFRAERLLAEELKADRDCWRGQAMMMADILPRR